MINQIFNEDNLITMSKMPDKFLDGIITSPPYGLRMHTKRKDCYYDNGYSSLDNLTEEEYIKTRLNEFLQFQRLLKDKGVILYNISYNNANAILPLMLMCEVHKQTDLTVVDMISWSKKTNIPFQTSPRLLGRKVEQIYVIVNKTNLHTFQTNKEVSKINEKTGQKFYKGYTNLIEAKNNDGIKCDLKASYSTDLVKKLIDIYFPKGSLIFDPFSGIATTAVACKESNLDFIGSEINETFWQIGNERLK
jgi:site-specific DNA-methyltransferase (adenine-specific)